MPIRLPLSRAGIVTGDQIAADALQYQGQGYVYGGSAAHPGDWDCSSFVSYVLGHDLGLSLPGGKWGGSGMPPGSHGPVVESYASWRGAITVQTPTRGDLVCFVGVGASGHIGIVLGVNQMVSALDSSQGTLVTPITGYGPPGAPIVYRRVTAAAAGSVLSGGGATGGADPRGGLAGALLTVLLVGGTAGAVIVAAAVLGTGAVLAGTWIMTKAAGSA